MGFDPDKMTPTQKAIARSMVLRMDRDVKIKRPGRNDWETGADLMGSVPLADVVGSLVRYPSGIVLKVTGLTDPDAEGNRHLHMELNDEILAE